MKAITRPSGLVGPRFSHKMFTGEKKEKIDASKRLRKRVVAQRCWAGNPTYSIKSVVVPARGAVSRPEKPTSLLQVCESLKDDTNSHLGAKKNLHSMTLKTTAPCFCLLDGLTSPHSLRGMRKKVKTAQSSAVRRSWGPHLSWKSSRGDGGSLWSHPLSYLQKENNAASFLMKEGIRQSEMNATWGGHRAILCSN